MKKTAARIGIGIALIAGLLAYGRPASAADTYSFSTIDVPGSISTVASGIDILGRIAGYYTDSAGTHGFLLTSSGLSTIDYPGAAWTAAYGINASGQVVGAYGANGSTGRHGFLLGGGNFSSFDVPSSSDTVARGINNRGQIVGDFMGPDGVRHGFLLSGGNFSTVDAPDSNSGSASAINDAAQIAGVAGTGGSAKGFFYSAGAFSKIQYPDSPYTEVLGLNNLGDLVGLIDNPQAPSRGFRRNGSSYVAMELPESPASWDARSVNDLGQIVGAFTGRDGKTHGYRATPNALRLGPSDSQGVTRISDASTTTNGAPGTVAPGAVGPQGPQGPQGPMGPPGPAGAARPAADRDGPTRATARVLRELESTRDGFRRVSGALERAISGAVDMEHEREVHVGRALAVLVLALADADSAISYVKEHPGVANGDAPKTARIEFTFPEADRGKNPSLQVGLNQVNGTIRSLMQIPGGDLGGYRAKLLSDLSTAAGAIIAANHAPRDSRGRGGRGTPAQPAVTTGTR